MAEQGRPNKLVYVAIGAVHLTAVTLTWRDLGRRPAEQVRGKKVVWRIASALNTLGSVAYWVFGRRRG